MRISSVIVICDTGINTPINGDGAFGLNRAGNKKGRNNQRIFECFHFDYLYQRSQEQHDRGRTFNDFHRIDGSNARDEDEAAAKRRAEASERAGNYC